MKKLRKVNQLAKKARIKIKNRDFVYKNKSAGSWARSAREYHKKYGTKKMLQRARKEFSAASRNPTEGLQLSFPNGIKSGFSHSHMRAWYEQNAIHTAIVIPSYNDYELLGQCLESIRTTTNARHVSVVVVDDYCTAESRTQLSRFDNGNVTVLFRDKNGGFAKAVNTGLRHVQKHHPKSDVFLLNSDTTAHPGWLENLQFAAHNYHKKVGIVGPKLLYPDGTIQSAGSHRNTEYPEWFDHYYRFKPAAYGPACVPQYCIGVTGAALYITNKTFKQIGLLDERFQFAFEDMDYCLRAWQAGIRSLYFPESVLTHHESVSRAKHANLKPREKASVAYFWKKWGDWFDGRNVKTPEGKTRIIYVLQSTGVSGGHKIAFQHLDNLRDQGYDTELWALDKAPTWTELRTPTRTFKNYETLVRSLEQQEAIKVATWWETAMPVWLSSINKGIPAFVIHEVETAFYPDNPEVQSSVASSYRKEFNNIISCGYTMEGMGALGLTGTLIPCAYDDRIYKPLPDAVREPRTVLALGRTFFQKNVKQTINAWKSIDANERPRLLLFGSQPHEFKKLKSAEYVAYPSDGRVNELYNSATIFMQTSYHEGFCLPALEAMATGCPLICTDSHGNRDFCIDGRNCLIVEKDDVAGTADAITKLLHDAPLRERLVKEGYKTAQRYTWKVVTRQLDDFYDRLRAQSNRAYIKKTMKSYR